MSASPPQKSGKTLRDRRTRSRRPAVRAASKLSALFKLQKKLELPMLFLTFIWLFVLVAELVYGASPVLSLLGAISWSLFILYFFLRMMTYQHRFAFFKKNWIFILAILVSLLRFFPVAQSIPFVRALTATFGMQVIWIFVSADQSLRFVRRYLGRRGVGYAVALTFVVIFAGAAGMMHFEGAPEDSQGLQNFPHALWWTAMQMTNIGSAYSVRTSGGRIVCLAISVYAAAMFGYLTALLATLLLDREAKPSKAEVARQRALDGLRREIAELRRWIERDANARSGKFLSERHKPPG